MPTGPDIAGKQIQERTDRRIFMFGVGAADDDLSVIVKFECHLGADIDPQRLTDRLGQGDLALRRHGCDFVDDRHTRRSFHGI